MDVKLEQRRDLRREGTAAEAVLWQLLRARRFVGIKFRRQHPCGDHVLDSTARSGGSRSSWMAVST